MGDMKVRDIEYEDIGDDEESMPLTKRQKEHSSGARSGADHHLSGIPPHKKHLHPHHPAPKMSAKSDGPRPWIVGLVIVLTLIAIAALVVFVIPKLAPSPGGPGAGTAATAALDPALAAIVNDEKITKEELDKSYTLYFFLAGIPQEQQQFLPKSQFLSEYLVVQRLVLQEAKRSGIDFTHQQAQAYVDQLLAGSQVPESKLLADLQALGLSKEDLVRFYQEANILAVVMNRSVFNAGPLELPERVRASHIFTSNLSLAEGLAVRLKQGESFESLASQYNEDATTLTGGDLGYFVRGQMVPEFESVAFAQQPGQVSDIVKSQFGYHIIKTVDLRPAQMKMLVDINDNSEKVLALSGAREKVDAFITGLQRNARIVVSQEFGGSAVAGTNVPSSAAASAVQLQGLTFQDSRDPICTDAQGRPIIRMFSTSWCPHCQWIRETMNAVMNEYVQRGLITAYHWQLDTDMEEISGIKGTIPPSEMAVYQKYNPQGSIPTFVFGCKYVRIGNGYEQQGDLRSERAEFEKIIDELIAATKASAPTPAPAGVSSPPAQVVSDDASAGAVIIQ